MTKKITSIVPLIQDDTLAYNISNKFDNISNNTFQYSQNERGNRWIINHYKNNTNYLLNVFVYSENGLVSLTEGFSVRNISPQRIEVIFEDDYAGIANLLFVVNSLDDDIISYITLPQL